MKRPFASYSLLVLVVLNVSIVHDADVRSYQKVVDRTENRTEENRVVAFIHLSIFDKSEFDKEDAFDVIN